MSGEKKYDLANLPANTDLRTLAATIKARWICEQAHQQLKEELGLDHFESRSWHGLRRHALMTMIVYAFLQHRWLAAARGGKKNQRATASTDLTRRQAIIEFIARPQRCPHCRKWICNGQRREYICQSSARTYPTCFMGRPTAVTRASSSVPSFESSKTSLLNSYFIKTACVRLTRTAPSLSADGPRDPGRPEARSAAAPNLRGLAWAILPGLR
jgi:hypothetical protein